MATLKEMADFFMISTEKLTEYQLEFLTSEGYAENGILHETLWSFVDSKISKKLKFNHVTDWNVYHEPDIH